MSPVRLQSIAQHHGLLPRRLRSLHRAPAGTCQPPPDRAHDEPARSLVRRGTEAGEDHFHRLLGKAGVQAHVRRHDPGFRTMTRAQGHRLRTPTDGRLETKTGPELRDGKRHQSALSRYAPKEIIQYLQGLTLSPLLLGLGYLMFQ